MDSQTSYADQDSGKHLLDKGVCNTWLKLWKKWTAQVAELH